MKKKLTNNLSLKICSCVFAVLLWLVVVNVDNPVKTKQFDNITVKMQNLLRFMEDAVLERHILSTKHSKGGLHSGMPDYLRRNSPSSPQSVQ